MTLALTINLLVFAGALIALGVFTRGQSLPRRVLAGMLAGLTFGFALQLAWDAPVLEQTLAWT
ncbi:MAG TPA: L-cystine transporter, partial [Gammaproteobacteria bacterium]|nr:L-cystine transporter [Gammaproteobacteria bacterium]